MGPIIVLDKSSLQCLSAQELEIFYRFYSLNVPPVLVIEILGDLLKPGKGGALTGKDVIQLSSKLRRMDISVNAHYRAMIAGSLLGNKITMDGRPVIPGGRFVRDGAMKGLVFEESPEEVALRRWANGEFKQSEAVLSHRWRQSTKTIDLEKTKVLYKQFAELVQDVKTFPELVQVADQILSDPQIQLILLKQIILEFSFHPKLASQIFMRWEQRNFQTVKDFAKYAYYCFHVTFSFYLGLVRHFLGTRPTNKIDLEYAYYAPFAMAFSSRDKFHKTFVPPFLRSNQLFVDGDLLKEDLKTLFAYFDAMTPEELQRFRELNGPHPPDNTDSVTNQLWERNMLPRSRLRPTLSKSDTPLPSGIEEILEKLDNGEQLQSDHGDVEGIDFMVRKHTITGDDPCPCQSGKKFRDCHMEEVDRNQK